MPVRGSLSPCFRSSFSCIPHCIAANAHARHETTCMIGESYSLFKPVLVDGSRVLPRPYRSRNYSTSLRHFLESVSITSHAYLRYCKLQGRLKLLILEISDHMHLFEPHAYDLTARMQVLRHNHIEKYVALLGSNLE